MSDWLNPENTAFVFLGLALVLAFTRLVRGPSLPDRVVALELTAMASVATIGAYAIDTDDSVLLEVAIVVALITFLGTVAFARYLERRGRGD